MKAGGRSHMRAGKRDLNEHNTGELGQEDAKERDMGWSGSGISYRQSKF